MVRDGYFYGCALLLVAVLLHVFTGSWIWPVVPILLALFFLWFFRDPERSVPVGPGLVVSPGDGVVTATEAIHTPDGEKLRLSIFLSVFDVHVNRSPIAGVVREVHYQKGKYLNAMNPDCAGINEQNVVVVEGEGHEVTFKQIAGMLARRIVFTRRIGDRVERGERVGLIKFGSRVDVLLPANATLRVAKGTRVKGGATILAELTDLTSPSVGHAATSEALV